MEDVNDKMDRVCRRLGDPRGRLIFAHNQGMETLDELLRIMPAEEDREELRRLARELGPDDRGPGKDQIVDQMMERIGWGLRAARHPLPTRQEVERMVRESRAAEKEE
jgi:hypothetical protein